MTDFAKRVKLALMEKGKNQKWLEEQVAKIYKGNLNPGVISLAINKGYKTYPEVKIAIAKILGIQF